MTELSSTMQWSDRPGYSTHFSGSDFVLGKCHYSMSERKVGRTASQEQRIHSSLHHDFACMQRCTGQRELYSFNRLSMTRCCHLLRSPEESKRILLDWLRNRHKGNLQELVTNYWHHMMRSWQQPAPKCRHNAFLFKKAIFHYSAFLRELMRYGGQSLLA